MTNESPQAETGKKTYSADAIIAIIGIAVFIIINITLVSGGVFKDASGEALGTAKTLGVMVGAGLTLMMFTFLYRDNPFFRLAEHIYLGLSVGYLITVVVHDWLPKQLGEPFFKPLFYPGESVTGVEWTRVFPIILGLFILARFVPKIAWLSRYSFAILVGWGAGLMIPQVIYAFVFKQAKASIVALNAEPSFFSNMSAVISFVGLLCVLVYFFFSVRHEGPVKPVAETGKYFIMISLGATFGYTVMQRISLLAGRVDYLLLDWLHIIAK